MHEVTIQVGPQVNLKYYASDPINNSILTIEANMVVEALVNYNLALEQVPCAVRFRTDDLGDRISYPVLELDGHYYEINFINRDN